MSQMKEEGTMTFWQRLKAMLKQGQEPHYLKKNPNKPPKSYGLKKRGVGWTRKDRSCSKSKRKMAQASRRANR